MANANLSRPFIIEFNHQFVVNPTSNASLEDEGRAPASVGPDRRDAAVFKLEDGFLRRVDENNGPPAFLGRFVVEPLAFMPMPVYWILQRNMVQPCTFTGDESSPEMLKSNGILGRCPIVLVFGSDYE